MPVRASAIAPGAIRLRGCAIAPRGGGNTRNRSGYVLGAAARRLASIRRAFARYVLPALPACGRPAAGASIRALFFDIAQICTIRSERKVQHLIFDAEAQIPAG